MIPSSLQKTESDSVRGGTCPILTGIEPLTGRCHAAAGEGRTSADRSEFIRYPAHEIDPDAQKIMPVTDNLNIIHSAVLLYRAFLPEEAHRVRQKRIFRFAPTHSGWLDIAEVLITLLSVILQKR